jgi:hypothetical protein
MLEVDPDVGDQPVVGWRSWEVSNNKFLTSPHLVWVPRERVEATCEKFFASDEHMAPELDCSCGIYAFDSLKAMKTEYYWTSFPISGEVWLWGKIVQHKTGFRAQYAYPKKLYFFRHRVMPDGSKAEHPGKRRIPYAEYLADEYGVPFEIVPDGHPMAVEDARPKLERKPANRIARPPKASRAYEMVAGYATKQVSMPPQMRALLTILDAETVKGAKVVKEADLQAAVFNARASGVLRTNQVPWRIFQYYLPELVKFGLVKVVKI